jgi:hypothetical protein
MCHWNRLTDKLVYRIDVTETELRDLETQKVKGEEKNLKYHLCTYIYEMVKSKYKRDKGKTDTNSENSEIVKKITK